MRFENWRVNWQITMGTSSPLDSACFYCRLLFIKIVIYITFADMLFFAVFLTDQFDAHFYLILLHLIIIVKVSGMLSN